MERGTRSKKRVQANLTTTLTDLLNALATSDLDSPAINRVERRELASQLSAALAAIQKAQLAIDQIRMPDYVLDPSDPALVGRLIANTLLLKERSEWESTG